jgi:hypothetical protein
VLSRFYEHLIQIQPHYGRWIPVFSGLFLEMMREFIGVLRSSAAITAVKERWLVSVLRGSAERM